MRLYLAELKRLMMARSTIVILIASIAISAVMAILPITYVGVEIKDNGLNKELKGTEAIHFFQKAQSPSYGKITPSKLKDALLTYKECAKEHEGIVDMEVNPELFPMDVYREKILPIAPLLGMIKRTYDENINGALMPRPLEDISFEEIDLFYDECANRIKRIALVESVTEEQQNKSLAMFSKVEKPFVISGFYDSDALEYVGFCVFFIVVFSVVISAASFSRDYETGADCIIRCTKSGRNGLANARMLANLTVNAMMFVLAILVHFALSYNAFGMECVQTSVQTIWDTAIPVTLNLKQMHAAIIIGGMLSMLAGSSMSFFISSKIEKSIHSIAIAWIVSIAPVILYFALGNSWLSVALPTSGVGLNNSLEYQILDYRFLQLGKHCFWTPQVTMSITIMSIPLFMLFAGRSYCRHKIK